MSGLDGTTAVVTGASRGLGRAVAAALVDAGAQVVGVGRDDGSLRRAQDALGPRYVPVPGDAADPALAVRLLTTCRPQVVVLAAGAAPALRPLQAQTWESFSRAWEVDMRQAFAWTQQALLQPLAPGGTVVAFSSGAALQGSPLSGGYAGAKAAVRFVAAYAAQESARAGLGLRFTCVLPRLTPLTDLGAEAAAAYAARAGAGPAAGPASPTPEDVAQGVLRLVLDPSLAAPAYLPGAGGALTEPPRG